MSQTFDATEALTTSISLITIPNPILNIVNSRGVVQRKAGQELWRNNDLLDYNDDSFLDINGSYFPASVNVKEATPATLNVEIKVGHDLIGKKIRLEARLDGTPRVAWSEFIDVTEESIAKLLEIPVRFKPSWAVVDLP